jgi:hypothetical protein
MLARMATDNADNRVKAGNVGAVEAAVAAMHRYIGSTGMQRDACSALSFIIYDNADNRAKAGNTGAIEAAVAAMCRHSVSVGLQHTARVALSLMANGNTGQRGQGRQRWRCRGCRGSDAHAQEQRRAAIGAASCALSKQQHGRRVSHDRPNGLLAL